MAGAHRRTRSHSASARTRRTVWQRQALLVAAIAGLCVMLYPAAATWMTANAQSGTMAAYAEQVRNQPASETQKLLTEARAYNRSLPQGVLRDPYGASADRSTGGRAYTDEYLRQLAVSGSELMASVDIPSIRTNLPIYHGTSPATLDLGAGHLFGSSLPVGGKGTHAVVTAHSGLPQATMFSELTKVRTGDLFTITVLGEALTYKVDQISVVKPDDVSRLAIVPGKDYVTLVTCTPLYVNSHRLLVRGVRVPTPADAAQRVSAPAGPGMPWWIPVLVVVPSAVAVLLFAPRRRNPAKSRNEPSPFSSIQ